MPNDPLLLLISVFDFDECFFAGSQIVSSWTHILFETNNFVSSVAEAISEVPPASFLKECFRKLLYMIKRVELYVSALFHSACLEILVLRSSEAQRKHSDADNLVNVFYAISFSQITSVFLLNSFSVYCMSEAAVVAS